jgi:hypothetical protein
VFAWPLTARMVAVERTPREVYPRFLVQAFVNQEAIGTGALRHERLIFTAGWGLYVAVIVRTAWGAGWLG